MSVKVKVKTHKGGGRVPHGRLPNSDRKLETHSAESARSDDNKRWNGAYIQGEPSPRGPGLGRLDILFHSLPYSARADDILVK